MTTNAERFHNPNEEPVSDDIEDTELTYWMNEQEHDRSEKETIGLLLARKLAPYLCRDVRLSVIETLDFVARESRDWAQVAIHTAAAEALRKADAEILAAEIRAQRALIKEEAA